ncbi:hypothetical protein IEQ34_016437 [Dendrobium chrysotoxum]|uniref:Protein kinase domain-containing protein n=1 Tax=Dendrobium chrysotoxum TaxID=161865 RepID=A0AAV7GFK4_DENCH|nr:hypothetical protein IEQ34_016437 [Dendrobium chrysotoxum]
MEDTYGGPVIICYKHLDQDLVTLVTISSIEDLDIMMEDLPLPPYVKENSLTEFNGASSNESDPSHIVGVTPKVVPWKNNTKGTSCTLHLDARGDGFIDKGISLFTISYFVSTIVVSRGIGIYARFERPLEEIYNVQLCELSAGCRRNGWWSWAWAGGQHGRLEIADFHGTGTSISRSTSSPVRFEGACGSQVQQTLHVLQCWGSQSFTNKGWGAVLIGVVAHFPRKADVVLRGGRCVQQMGVEVGARALDGVCIDGEWPLALTTFFGASDALILDWSSRSHHVSLNEYQSNIRSITFFFKECWPTIVIVLITTPPIDEDRRLRKESFGDDPSCSCLPERTNGIKLLSSPFHLPSIYSNSPTSKYLFFPMAVGPLNINRIPSASTIPPTANLQSSRKKKLCCKFGGKLMPRLSDGALHYVGGQKRLMAFSRDITLQEFYCKMEDIYGGPVVICYKLSDQELDTLVSITSDEDLDNMMEECDYLLEASEYGSAKLQVFLFPPYDRENSLAEFNDSESSHIVEVTSDANASKDNMEGPTSTLHLDVGGDGFSDKGGQKFEVDVFSFGIVMWELLMGQEPYANIPDEIIKNCDLDELQELGCGTFGAVYHGKWRGADVAIKRIHDIYILLENFGYKNRRADFWNEIFMLANLHHPNIISFYGIVWDGPRGSFAAITEYMVDGSLRSALINYSRFLDKRKCILIAIDVAFGMEYLHDQNIIHFDLKSDNLLVNLRDPNRPICKVGDFGLSKVKCSTSISSYSARGTIPWMAPELLNGRRDLVSEKVDVFSFGIVMWELLMGQEPYANISDEDIKVNQSDALYFGVINDIKHIQIIKNCDLDELRELGSGTFGAVYHGKWRGANVAIKRIHDIYILLENLGYKNGRADFWNEIFMLANLHHPNIITFYGIVWDGPGGSFAVITEYMVDSSVQSALINFSDMFLDKKKRLLIAIDVAFGMEYLHDQNIIHFDLKSDNLLINLRDPH